MNISQIALFEHRFWLQILGDHARFIYHSLSPEETAEISTARNFINTFDNLLEQAREGVNLSDLNRRARRYTEEFRQFKLELLRKHLTGDIIIGLTPTFINHMVNELEEYLEILNYLMTEIQSSDRNIIEQHLLWLLDAKGHAGAINDDLNLVEQKLKQESLNFVHDFDNLYDKAVEIAGYMRTTLDNFPALERFNIEAENEIREFMTFLERLLDLELNNQLLGTLHPLLIDHMLREECYYLIRLARETDVTRPACNPARRRIED